MNIDTAIQNLLSFKSFEFRQIYRYIRLYIESLRYISNDDHNYLLRNILSFIEVDKVTIRLPERNGEQHVVECLPLRRLVLYRILQAQQYITASEDTVMTLHNVLVERLHSDDEMSEILLILNKLYQHQCFCNERNRLLQIIQKASVDQDKRDERVIKTLMDTILSKQFPYKDKVVLLHNLFQLADFGIVEYFTASHLFRFVKEAWNNTYLEMALKHVMVGFADSNLAFAASILLKILIDLSDDETIILMDHVRSAFTSSPIFSSRTLSTSFEKYIVPTCTSRFGESIFNHSRGMHIYYRLIICKHIYTAKRCFQKRQLLMPLIEKSAQSFDPNIAALGFELLCFFPNKRVKVSASNLDLFRKLLMAIPEMTPVIKRSIKYFISQITVMYYGNRTRDCLRVCLDFYEWLEEFVLINIAAETSLASIVSEVYCFAVEVLIKSSEHLVTSFNYNEFYQRNPLYTACKERHNIRYYDIKQSLYKNYIETTSVLLVAETILHRVYYQSFKEDIFQFSNTFFELLLVNQSWSAKKLESTSKILIKVLDHLGKYDAIVTIRNMLIQMCHESILKLACPLTSVEGEAAFDISAHIGIQSTIMELDGIPKSYQFEYEKAAIQIMDIVSVYNFHSKEYHQQRCVKKGIERSVIALLNHMFTAAKYAKYPEASLVELFNTTSHMINSVPLKKVIIVAAQNFQELVKASPQFESNFIYFYTSHKERYLQSTTNFTLRKSGGIRNFLHIFFKFIKKQNFLDDEVNSLITDRPNEQILHVNLKINLLECIIADKEMKKRSHKFIIPIFERALYLLSNPHFLIKNSCVQLISVICTRLLGPLSELGIRELSVMDVFSLHPDLCDFVSHKLFSEETIPDVKIVLLGFLAESNRHGHLHSLPCDFDIRRLKEFFSDEYLCGHALKAFLACSQRNKLYDILSLEFRDIDLDGTDILRLTNEIELLQELSEQYIKIFPDSSKIEVILFELNKVLTLWHCKRVTKVEFPILPLDFIPKETLKENEETQSLSEESLAKVNDNYILVNLEYISRFVDKIDSDLIVIFIKALIKFLMQNGNLSRQFVFSARKIINSLTSPLVCIDYVGSWDKNDIYIQEIYMKFISNKRELDAYDVQNINIILENVIEILSKHSEASKVHIVLDMLQRVSKFLFVIDINLSNYLFILWKVTYIIGNDPILSSVYCYLTTFATSPKSGLFLLLNHLHLYIPDKMLQKKLLTKFCNFLNEQIDISSTIVYADPTSLIEKIHFQSKLHQNVLYLLK